MSGGGSEICALKTRSSFKKNINRPLYIIASSGYSGRKIMQYVALLATIHVLATFMGQYLHGFLRREDLGENNFGN